MLASTDVEKSLFFFFDLDYLENYSNLLILSGQHNLCMCKYKFEQGESLVQLSLKYLWAQNAEQECNDDRNDITEEVTSNSMQ